jgi:ligand-binding sensor domain-containing protein
VSLSGRRFGCLLPVLCVPLILAQSRFDHWMTDNGLPGNTVRELRRYLWLTTVNGLVRFDSVRLTIFDKNNSPAFPGNRCHPLLEDRAGKL